MKIPIRNIYYLLCYAWGHVPEKHLVDVEALEPLEEVQDLLGKVLAEGVFRLFRRGIDRGYRELTHEIAGVRGKLEVGAMATQAVKARGTTICTFEEYTPDVLHNRILKSTLARLLAVGGLQSAIGRDVSLALQKLSGVSTIQLDPRAFHRVQLDRNQRFYRFLLSVCWLIYDSLLPTEDSGEVRFRDFRRDDARMWKLFEDFVLEFYRRELASFSVSGGRYIPWGQSPVGPTLDEPLLPRMELDVLLESADRRIILDTKFYREPLRFRSDVPKLRSNNLYQILTYLENRQAARPEGPRHEGVLLYAVVSQPIAVDVVLQGYRLQVRTVDLGATWERVHQQLLDVVA